ncbi:MAG: hypothetical protein WC352_09280 [Candidatus Omnitrophota bacterium]|jgi:hypothetical protein
MSGRSDQDISEIYRGYLRAELEAPEVERAKKLFVLENFGRLHGFPVWPVACFATAAAAVLIFILAPLVHRVPSGVVVPANVTMRGAPVAPAVERTAVSPALPQAEVVPPAVPDDELPSVVVTRVESDMGQVMVYKESAKDHPMTIIWIFPGR